MNIKKEDGSVQLCFNRVYSHVSREQEVNLLYVAVSVLNKTQKEKNNECIGVWKKIYCHT